MVSIVGLAWGSSRFYQSLDGAVARIFEERTRRPWVALGFRGLASVGLLTGALVGATCLGFVAQNLGTTTPGLHWALGAAAATLGSGLGAVVIFAAAMAIIYRVVPLTAPSWRAVGAPAIAVGTIQAVFTLVFAGVAPRIVGSLEVYGAFVAVFAAMLWLSVLAQAILIGAAWVHRRDVAGRKADAAGEDAGREDVDRPEGAVR